jgi:hypothetical protein
MYLFLPYLVKNELFHAACDLIVEKGFIREDSWDTLLRDTKTQMERRRDGVRGMARDSPEVRVLLNIGCFERHWGN